MEMQSFESSVVKATGYSRVLEIEFQSGRVYQYFDVDESVYLTFLKSESKGKYFNAHIRGKYPYREIWLTKPPQPK